MIEPNAGLPQPNDIDKDVVIKELRKRIGLLESELEQLRREHAALEGAVAHDVAALARRYLESPKPTMAVRNVDGVIFGNWYRGDCVADSDAADAARNSRSA